MTRRKQHANGRAGLWQDTTTQPYVPAHDLRIEQEASPLTRPCDFCHAAPRQPCTRPARGGRKPLTGWHPTRLNPPQEQTP